MTVLTYACPPELSSLADKAVAQWNSLLKGHVRLRRRDANEVLPNILILFGKVNRSNQANRIAECRHIGEDLWTILLADDEKWAISWWQRLVGNGHNALSALLHELGHVFDLPHATNPAFIMHPNIPNTNSIGRRERELYRNLFITKIDP